MKNVKRILTTFLAMSMIIGIYVLTYTYKDNNTQNNKNEVAISSNN